MRSSYHNGGDTVAIFRSMTPFLDPDMGRDAWIKTLMGAKAGDCSPEMEEAVKVWSSGGKSYRERDFLSAWRSISPGGGIGFGSLIVMARAAGWQGDTGTTTATPIERPAKPEKPKQEAKKLWPDAGMAARIISTLERAKDNEQAREFLKADYALEASAIPDDWWLFDHPKHGLGVVYRGYDLAGEPVHKFKALARDNRGKRPCAFLHGGAGHMALGEPSHLGLVVVAGEEKAATSASMGYEVFCPLTGESGLTQEQCGLLLSGERPAKIFLMNDHDDAGRKANQKSAEELVAAGYPGENVLVVQWDETAPEGFDINDVAKSGGIEAVRKLIENAKPFQSPGPRCMCAADFLAIERPPLQFHIDGILPYGGKLTFSATSKWGKSMWAIQTGMALAAGDCQWLGWQFGAPARVLYVQAEIMDGLVENRLRWMFESMPGEIDKVRAGQNFLIREIANGRPNLMSDAGRLDLETTMERERPEVLILDPLAALFPGMEENAAESMSLALDYVANVAQRFACAVILFHHHSKAGSARGSSVFEAWPESDIQASFLSDDNKTVAKVVTRLRCAYNAGPLYWQMPSPEAPWFEKMPDDFEPSKGRGRPTIAKPEFVATVIKANGKPMRYGELKDSIIEAAGVGKSKAEYLIRDAKEQGLIFHAAGIYAAPGQAP